MKGNLANFEVASAGAWTALADFLPDGTERAAIGPRRSRERSEG